MLTKEIIHSFGDELQKIAAKDTEENHKKHLVDMELSRLKSLGLPATREQARRNAFALNHVLPRTMAAHQAANEAAEATARFSPIGGLLLGAAAGGALGGLLGHDIGDVGVGMAGGSVLGELAGVVHKRIAQNKAFDRTLANKSNSLGISPYVKETHKGVYELAKDVELPDEWKKA